MNGKKARLLRKIAAKENVQENIKSDYKCLKSAYRDKRYFKSSMTGMRMS